jgi:predicted peptidase
MKQQNMKFEKEKLKKISLDYLLYLPENYESKSEWPLILFLHGAGEVGDDIEIVKSQGLPKKLESTDEIPFVVVSPQCPRNNNWGMLFDVLYELLQSIKKKYKIIEKKVYLTGLSMGGYGTWALSLRYPDEFAALVPICGGVQNKNDVEKLKNIPIWTFHGAKDRDVPIEISQSLVDVLKAYGGNIQFTIYPELGHDSWTKTYNNPDLYDWLLKQERK